jgi:hypothetical protein
VFATGLRPLARNKTKNALPTAKPVETGYFSTASVKGGKVQTEQNLSDLHLKADVPKTTADRVKQAAVPQTVR